MSKTIMERVTDHYTEALKRFNESNIVICALQGSQNYGLELPTSDVDTKLIVTPSFRDIALDRKPVSTTFVRDNEEHTEDKDNIPYSYINKNHREFKEELICHK